MAKGPRAWVVVHAAATNQILLGKRADGARSPGEWNLFGGRIDAGETPRDAARRELQEEIGLAVAPSDLDYLGEVEGHHFFLLHADPSVIDGLRCDADEISKVKWFSFGALPKPEKHHRSTALLLKHFVTIRPRPP